RAGPTQTVLADVAERADRGLRKRADVEKINARRARPAGAGSKGRTRYHSPIASESRLRPIVWRSQSRHGRERSADLGREQTADRQVREDMARQRRRASQTGEPPNVRSDEAVRMVKIRRPAIKLLPPRKIPRQGGGRIGADIGDPSADREG